MNAKSLLIKALTEMGADGLVNTDMECGCGLDDFEPCDECVLRECEPAKLNKEDGYFYPMEET
jgi:hypothetical protein